MEQFKINDILILAFCFLGITLFLYWLISTGFGKRALDGAVVRPNCLPFYAVFTVLFGWLGITIFTTKFITGVTSQMPEWRQNLILYSALVAIEIIIIGFVLGSAKRFFDDGLRGLGFRKTGIIGDFGSAAATFTAVWPLVMGALYVVVIIGKLIAGPDFQMEKNEGLTVILQYDQWSLRILMIFFATILTPIFEEIIFRGLLQSYLREIGLSCWQTIFIASVIFSLLHPMMHFPALIILAVAMGYAYEKSGSLLRPIFIHLLFNGSTIAFALLN
ncbi:MAG: CPBP family intramembrane glutamic endopeptidase [Phycisphaerae bacterium]|jgi:membrane protease YdiL (CAAX protease family)